MRTFLGMDYQDAIKRYTDGFCHVFAIASVRKHGGSFLIVEDYAETHYESEDGDDLQNVVVHVYAVHDTPDGLIARDIHGDRLLDIDGDQKRERERGPLQGVLEEVQNRFDALEPTHNGGTSSEEELMDLVHGDHDRSIEGMEPPLDPFSEEDVEEAMKWVDWLPFIETELPVRTDLLPPVPTPSADEPTAAMAL